MGNRRGLIVIEGSASVLTAIDLAVVLAEWGKTDHHSM